MTKTTDLRSAAIDETHRLESKRRSFNNDRLASSEALFLALPAGPSSPLRALAGLIFLFRLRIVDGLGRLLESVLLPVRVPIVMTARETRDQRLGRRVPMLVRLYGQPASEAASAAGSLRASAIQQDHRLWLSGMEARERHLASMLNRRHPQQPGLFYQRSDEPIASSLASPRSSVGGAEVTVRPPVLVMLLLVSTDPAV